MVNIFHGENERPSAVLSGKPGFLFLVIPDIVYRASIWPFLQDGPPLPTCGDDRKTCHARRFLSGIHPDSCPPLMPLTPDAPPLTSSTDGPSLPTCGVDDWYAFGLDHLFNGIRCCPSTDIEFFTIHDHWHR